MIASLALLVLPLVHSAATTPVTQEAGAPVFALRKTADGITLERLVVREATPLRLPCGADKGWLELVLPPGPGASGSIIHSTDDAVIEVKLADGKLQPTRIAKGRPRWPGPAQSVAELRGLRIRVCITAADGTGAAFVIEGWDRAHREKIGPVVDLFAGRIPLGKGDYAFSTDTIRLRTGPATSGSCPLVHDRYLFAKGRLPRGGEGWFVIDTGGSVTTVVRSALPEGCKVEQAHAIQFTSGKRKLVKYTPQGATGNVTTVAGTARLDELVFGDLRFENAHVTVLESLPDLFGRPVVGILGLDLLRRAPRCRFDFAQHRLTLLDKAKSEQEPAASLPFTYVKDHVMIEVQVDGTPVSMILDTGSPGLFLDAQAARAAGLTKVEGKDKKARGLDSGGTVTTQEAAGRRTVRLGDATVEGQKSVFGPLPVFNRLRGRGHNVGLLGNSVLVGFAGMELAFDSNRMLLFQ